MSPTSLTRRNFLARSAFATLAAGAAPFVSAHAGSAEIPMPKASGALEENLDACVAAYLPAMNAPGLTLGLTSADRTLRTACYGYSNLEAKLPVTPSLLFQIGSITKSFVALVLLQLREEGKLDLHAPILDYLPGLPIVTEFGIITVHHLLTHTSGLPDNLGLFSSDPASRLIQAYKPGEHFHYCNAGFDILGLLAAKLDNRTWRRSVQARIFDPLGMTATVGVIDTSSRDRMAQGYEAFWDDQVYSRQGRLAPAPNLIMDDTAGCIASTPADMAAYLRMLLNRGKYPGGRIVSDESFTLFSTPYIKADDFSPTASYGYGVAVDTLDGHKILRHTGGMFAFASSMHADLDSGVACFASINAMQGYRPTEITEYAIRLARAQQESKSLPTPPPITDPRDIDNASDYAGTYSDSDGRKLTFTAEGRRLHLFDAGQLIPLQHAGGDAFLSTVAGRFARYTINFGRKESTAAPSESQSTAAKVVAPVVEVTYGPNWFVNSAYSGPHAFHSAPEFDAFIGRYCADSAWGGDVDVYMLKGKLTVDGDPIVPIGANLFRAAAPEWSPEIAEFTTFFEGKSMLLKFAGTDLWRIEVD